MPKKYQQKSLLTKPTPKAASSLSLSRHDGEEDDAEVTRSVNQLINESRKSQGSIQHVTASSSVHPTLRAVLNLPTPDAPIPRYGIQGSIRTRRVAGPPPPRSWVNHRNRESANRLVNSSEPVHAGLRSINAPCSLPGSVKIDGRSLQHMVMVYMAQDWQWHATYDHEYLTELPITTRQLLLSYLGNYINYPGVNPLHTLFPKDARKREYEDIRYLDLSNAIGNWSSVRKIDRDLCETKRTTRQSTAQKNIDLPDNWDDAVTPPPRMVESSYCRFSHLKHLSLALRPGITPSSASWQDLVSFAARLTTITSLSLAHWPRPTYTPNASTSWHKISQSNLGSQPGNIIYGGSNYYSALDNDWREAAGILRSLSRSLYCLTWLDLTGCEEWFDALSWKPGTDDSDSMSYGPDWNGCWRDIEHLILAVGWTLAPVQDKFASHHLEKTIFRSPQAANTPQPNEWDVEQERISYRRRKEAERHNEFRNCAIRVGQEIRRVRRNGGGKWIEVEVGPAIHQTSIPIDGRPS